VLVRVSEVVMEKGLPYRSALRRAVGEAAIGFVVGSVSFFLDKLLRRAQVNNVLVS